MIFSLAAIPPATLRLVLLGASAFMLYGAGRLVMGAVPERADRPTLRALLGAALVLAVAVVTVIMGRPGVGLHLPIACATAAMSFGVASLLLGRPSVDEERAGNPSWALVAPAAAITLFGGLGGRFDWLPIASLIAFGIAALLGWREKDPLRAGASPPRTQPTDAGRPQDAPTFHPAHRGAPTTAALLLWIGGIALAALAGVLVMLGLPALESAGIPSDPLVVVFLLAPAIVVPIFFELLPPCRNLGWEGSMSVLAKFSLICLCFVLPTAALVNADAGVIRGLWASRAVAATTQPSTQAFTTATQPATAEVNAITDSATKLEFVALPALPLRADLLVLMGAMLLLIPLAAGWHRPGGMEAAALIVCYLFSLALVMASVVLWRR